MISIGSALPSTDEVAQLTRTRDAENQRNSWLREMELAQLSEMGKLDTSGAWSAATEPSGSSAWQSTALASFAVTSDGDAQAAASSPAAAQQAPAVNRHSDENAAATGDAAAESSANRASARSNGIVAQNASGPGAANLRSASAVPAAVASTLPGMAALPGATVRATPAQLDALPPLLQTAQPRAVGALPSATSANSQRDAAAAQEQTKADELAGADPSLEEKPSWEKRLMHVTNEGDNVDVWIRDSALGANQSLSLAYRLAGDIAGMGLKLRAATVNGKPLYRAASSVSSQSQNRTPTAQDAGIGANHSTIASTEENHGS